MSGSDNLIPLNQRTKSEQREIQGKGGRASGKSRRERASIRDALNAILSAPIKDKELKNEMKTMGAPEMNANSLFALRLYQRALQGDMQAARLVLQAIGEADPASLELARAKVDLEFLKLEAVYQANANEDSGYKSNFEEALAAAVDVWGPSEQVSPQYCEIEGDKTT